MQCDEKSKQEQHTTVVRATGRILDVEGGKERCDLELLELELPLRLAFVACLDENCGTVI
jgi:hypothetical protein